MRFAWQRLSTYGTVTASHCGASRRGPGTRPRAVVCWRWPRSTMVAAGRMRRGSAPISLRRSADHSRLGAALQHPRTGRAGRWEVTGRSKLNADHRRALAEVVEAGPVPAVDGVVRWRRKDLARWLLETFAISLDETTVGRELKALGFAKISARPRHYGKTSWPSRLLKKTSPPNWRRSGRGSRKASR